MMENLDSLIITLLDSDAMKGCFKKELGNVLNVPVVCITDCWLQSELTDGVVSQYLYVSFVDAKIMKEDLKDLPFEYIYENCIVFKVGDTII